MTTDRRATLTLPANNQIRVVREFDAPAHLVYRAWTTPELIRQWWHANRGVVEVAEVDLRVGGKWRYQSRTPDGMEVAFHGEFREIVPDARIVSTEVFEGAPTEEAVNTALFEADGDRTVLTLLMSYSSQEVRDVVLQTGMEDGLQDALALLEEVARA